jgi:hypothetical protein
MRINPVPHSLGREYNFNKNFLLVGGCSFTNQFDKKHCVSWPLYLRDLGGFQQLIDCSFPGAGNQHIHNSVIAELEQSTDLDATNTLVIVMWSGWDRDDFVADPDSINQSYCNSSVYQYNQHACAAVTGGLLGKGNLLINIDSVKKIKNNYSRALENYLYITSLKHYLVSRGFKFVFTEFADTNLELAKLLDPLLYQNYTSMVRKIEPTLGSYNQNYLNLSADGLHPAPEVHLRWTREILLPYLTTNLNTV